MGIPGVPNTDAGSGLELDLDRQPSAPFEVPASARAPSAERSSPAVETVKRRKPIRRSRPPQSAFRLILGAFFVLSAVGLYGALTDMTFRLSALPFNSASAATPKSGLALSPPEAKFIDTLPGAPRVFVVQTTVRNVSSAPRGEIYVGAILYDDLGKALSKVEAPCGNNFSDEQLRAFKDADDVAKAYSPMGDDLSNKRVNSGDSIRCTVVFYDAPDAFALARYELELTRAKTL